MRHLFGELAGGAQPAAAVGERVQDRVALTLDGAGHLGADPLERRAPVGRERDAVGERRAFADLLVVAAAREHLHEPLGRADWFTRGVEPAVAGSGAVDGRRRDHVAASGARVDLRSDPPGARAALAGEVQVVALPRPRDERLPMASVVSGQVGPGADGVVPVEVDDEQTGGAAADPNVRARPLLPPSGDEPLVGRRFKHPTPEERHLAAGGDGEDTPAALRVVDRGLAERAHCSSHSGRGWTGASWTRP